MASSQTTPPCSDPLLSVVMPAYNAAATVARAIRSVQAQGVEDWELLLVDDASTDATPEILAAAAAADRRIRPERLARNRGTAHARNSAVMRTRGRYIAFIDADDEWLPDKTKIQIARMQETGAAFCYSGFYRATNGRMRAIAVPDRLDYARLLRGNVVGCLTAIYSREELGRVFFPDIRLRQDYGLWLEILRPGIVGRGVTEPLAIHHSTQRSLSSNKLRASRATWDLYRRIEGLSRPHAAVCLASHLTRRMLSSLRAGPPVPVPSTPPR